MAVAVGFEPTKGVNPYALSRRAPSAARTRYRRSPYRTYRRHPSAVVSEELSEQGSALVSQDAADDLGAVRRPAVPDDVPQRPNGTALGLPGTEHQTSHPGRDQGTRAHRARLHGDHQGATRQPPAVGPPVTSQQRG